MGITPCWNYYSQNQSEKQPFWQVTELKPMITKVLPPTAALIY
jgi:hypothetical protein